MEEQKPPILDYGSRPPMPMRAKVLLGAGAAAAGVAIAVGGMIYRATAAAPPPLAGVPAPIGAAWVPAGGTTQPTTGPTSRPATRPSGDER